jgi:hypothetical protein
MKKFIVQGHELPHQKITQNHFNYNLISSIFKDRKLSLDMEEVEGNVDYEAEKGHNQRIERSISKVI